MRMPHILLCVAVVLALLGCSNLKGDPLVGAWVEEKGNVTKLIVFQSSGRIVVAELHDRTLGSHKTARWNRVGGNIGVRWYDEEGSLGDGNEVPITLKSGELVVHENDHYMPSGNFKKVAWDESEPMEAIPSRMPPPVEKG